MFSAPTITTKGAFWLNSEIGTCPSPDNPIIKKPFFFNSSIVIFKLSTLHTGICSKAPAATFATVPVNPADLLWGIIIPLQSKASADLIIAPKLWGSVTPSNATKIGLEDLLLDISINSSKDTVCEEANCRATPWWTAPFVNWDSLDPVSYTHLTLPTNREV